MLVSTFLKRHQKMYILFIVIPAALLVLSILILFLVKRSKQPDAESSLQLTVSTSPQALGGTSAIKSTHGREKEIKAGEQVIPSPEGSSSIPARMKVSELEVPKQSYTYRSFLHAAKGASVIRYQAIRFYKDNREQILKLPLKDNLNDVQKCQLEVIKLLAGRTDKFIPKGNNEFTCEHVYDQEKNESRVTIICGQDKISIFKFNETDAGFRHDLKTQQQEAIDAKYDKINESLNRNDELTTILTSIISSGKQDLSYVVDGSFKLTKDHKCEKVFCDLAEHTNNHMNKHSDEVVKLTQDHLDAINIMRATVASILEDNCLVSGNSHTVSKTR